MTKAAHCSQCMGMGRMRLVLGIRVEKGEQELRFAVLCCVHRIGKMSNKKGRLECSFPQVSPPCMHLSLQIEILDAKIWRGTWEGKEVALRKGEGGRNKAWLSWPHSVSDVVETQQL